MNKECQIVYDLRTIPIGCVIFLFVLSVIMMLSASFWLKRTKNFYEEVRLTQGYAVEVSWPRKGFELWFQNRKDAEKIMQAVLPSLGEMAHKLSAETLFAILTSTINQLDSGEFEERDEDEYFGCVRIGNFQKIYYHFNPDILKNREGLKKVMEDLVFLRRFLADQLFMNSPYQLSEEKKKLIVL